MIYDNMCVTYIYMTKNACENDMLYEMMIS